MNAIEILSATDSCHLLSCQDRQALLGMMRVRKYLPGEPLLGESEKPEHVGLIVSGRADAYVGSRIVQRLGPGDFFGEIRCLTDYRPLVTVVCREMLSAYILSDGDFLAFLEDHASLKNHLLQSALKKLWRIIEISYKESEPPDVVAPDRRRLPPALLKALNYIDQHYERKITFNQVAQTAGMSKSALSRLFKQALNSSFKTYLNQVRISQAKNLIAGKHLNVTEACFAVGYNDTAYFSRIFRKMEGRNPSQFKKEASIVPPLRIVEKH